MQVYTICLNGDVHLVLYCVEWIDYEVLLRYTKDIFILLLKNIFISTYSLNNWQLPFYFICLDTLSFKRFLLLILFSVFIYIFLFYSIIIIIWLIFRMIYIFSHCLFLCFLISSFFCVWGSSFSQCRIYE